MEKSGGQQTGDVQEPDDRTQMPCETVWSSECRPCGLCKGFEAGGWPG